MNAHPVRQMLLYGVGIALMKGVSLLMLPVIAHHLDTSEFGRLEVISTLAVFVSVVVGLGLDRTLFRFAGTESDEHTRRRIASQIFGITFIIGGITLLAGLLAAPSVTGLLPGEHAVYEVQLILCMLALEGCISVPLGWLRMRNRAGTFFLLTTGRALLHALLTFWALRRGDGVSGILEAGLIAACAQASIACLLQWRDTGVSLDAATSCKALRYSLPIVGSGLVAFMLGGMDRWVLAEYVSMHEVATYGIAAKFALAVVLLLQPFGMWWTPRRFEVLHGDDGREAVARYISLGSALVLIVSACVTLTAPLMIQLLFPESYHAASDIVFALVCIMMLRELSELVNIGCFSGEDTRAQFLINLAGSIIGVLLMLTFTPVHGLWGTLWALLAAQGLRLSLLYVFSQHALPLDYPTAKLMSLSVLAVGWMMLGRLIDDLMLITSVSVVAAASMLLFAISAGLIPNPGLRWRRQVEA